MANELAYLSVKKVNIWSIKINPIKLSEFIELIDAHISSHHFKPLHITGVNPETVAHSQRNPDLLNAIQDSDLVNIDNTLVLIMLRLNGISAPERVATPDLFESMLALAERKSYSIYILGAKQDILDKALVNIRSQFPGINIAGCRNGYFSEEQIPEVCDEIKKAHPHMLFLALPSPQKEMFIYNHKNTLNVPVLLGIGGAIDVVAGLVNRAPLFLRKIGLEGIHRALQNPSNYGKRYFELYPIFLRIVFNEFIKIKVINKFKNLKR